MIDELTISRFWAKVNKGTEDECWPWFGAHNGLGYGQMGAGPTRLYAHRLSYELAKGPIPTGLELDHLCRNSVCVNPKHLEAVTHQENNLRGNNNHRNKTHCPQGHPYDLVNTYRFNGGRWCRPCHKKADERYRIRKRAEKGNNDSRSR